MKEPRRHYDVAVVGGGASGMMAAGRAAERGKSVLLLEKNATLGRKLDISGGGRCNITNAEYDIHALLKHYGAAEHFLYSPFSRFGVEETFNFFTYHALPLVTEARKRAFPASQKAPDVTRTLTNYMEKGSVDVRVKTAVTGLIAESGKITGAKCRGTTYTADAFIIATGGVSHPETGSTGDGFKWLEALGHTVQAATPNIVPLKVHEPWVKKLAGVSLSFMKITFFGDGKRAFSKTGKLLFTHFGLSGPLILNSAGKVGELIEAGPVSATIDMYPDTDFSDVEKKVLKVLDGNKNKDFKNLLDELVPHGFVDAALTLMKLPDPKLKAHSLTKEDRKRFVHLLKAVPLTIDGLMGFDRAVVSDGGVTLKEVDTRTMRSLIIPNLYLTGDVLNISRPSGGYSLQLCWTTGFVAGDAV